LLQTHFDVTWRITIESKFTVKSTKLLRVMAGG
jgi:hypothetical protein